MPDAISLGEALIDLFATPVGIPLRQATNFMAAPGGAPATVAVALARLGIPAGFVGLVGSDPWGGMLLDLLAAEGVDTTHFRQLAGVPTTLAVVAAIGPNERDFILYRGADTRLRPHDLDRAYIASAKVFLYGSVTLSEAARDAALQAATYARQAGVLVAFDANLRPFLWPGLDAAREGIMLGVRTADLLKVNETELELLSGTHDLSAGTRRLLDLGPRLCVVTLGEAGAYFNNGRAEGHVPGFTVDAVDATGCGDAFLSGIVTGLLETAAAPDALDGDGLRRMMRFAAAVGALTATRAGAMAALPMREMVDRFLSEAQPEER